MDLYVGVGVKLIILFVSSMAGGGSTCCGPKCCWAGWLGCGEWGCPNPFPPGRMGRFRYGGSYLGSADFLLEV